MSAQGFRFIIAGGTVAVFYLAVTTSLADWLGVPFELALIVGFSSAIGAHFLLQRRFVWTTEGGFALTGQEQAGRYLIVAGTQYAVTATSIWLLPGALGVTVTPVYLTTTAVVSGLNFLLFRSVVFHPGDRTA